MLGTTYTFRLLRPEADDWVTSHTQGQTPAAVMLNSRKPTIAAALVSIDFNDGDGDIPVEKLFPLPDDMDAATKEAVMENEHLLRDWRREQVLAWLKDFDSYVVQRIYEALSMLLDKHKKELTKLESFGKRTPLDG